MRIEVSDQLSGQTAPVEADVAQSRVWLSLGRFAPLIRSVTIDFKASKHPRSGGIVACAIAITMENEQSVECDVAMPGAEAAFGASLSRCQRTLERRRDMAGIAADLQEGR